MTPVITNYKDAQQLYEKRAKGRLVKRVSASLELKQAGADFVVTSRSGVSILTISPGDVATIHFEGARAQLGRFSVVTHMWRYFRINIYRKTDRTCSHQWWYKQRRDGDRVPLVDNLRINLLTGAPLDPPPVVQRRRVQRDVAKPIREKISAWEKLALSYLTFVEAKEGMLHSVEAGLPKLEDEPTTEGLLRMMRYGAEKGWGYTLYTAYRGWHKEEWLRARAKRAFKLAFEHWKEQLYTEHNAYVWVDKTA
jgi:hypothetical protein